MVSLDIFPGWTEPFWLDPSSKPFLKSPSQVTLLPALGATLMMLHLQREGEKRHQLQHGLPRLRGAGRRKGAALPPPLAASLDLMQRPPRTTHSLTSDISEQSEPHEQLHPPPPVDGTQQALQRPLTQHPHVGASAAAGSRARGSRLSIGTQEPPPPLIASKPAALVATSAAPACLPSQFLAATLVTTTHARLRHSPVRPLRSTGKEIPGRRKESESSGGGGSLGGGWGHGRPLHMRQKGPLKGILLPLFCYVESTLAAAPAKAAGKDGCGLDYIEGWLASEETIMPS